MADIEKGKRLFSKGTEAFHNKNYVEALKYFEESTKLYSDDSTDVFIASCRKNIRNKMADSTPQEETKGNPEQDRDCEIILNKKDFYDIMGISKTATEDEIKRAYKKMAIKFHPDKNQSTHAADTFKKISHAFTTLKDPEKKQFYDKYGDEDELREKYHQQQTQQNRYEDEMDPFDLFEMFFSGNAGGFYQRNGRVFRRRNPQEEEAHENQYAQQRQNRVVQNPKYVLFMQFLPLIVLFLFSVVPYLFQSKPFYQFHINEEYYKKMQTLNNKVDYFVGDKYLKYFTTLDSIRNLEPQIEKEYLQNLSSLCANVIKYKNDLEYKLSYYGRYSNYKSIIETELKKIDFSPCEKYYKMRDRIR